MSARQARVDALKQGGDRCPECGKIRYLTRAHAKKTARRLRGPRRGHLNAYKCGAFYHLGHLPADVVSGDRARDEIVPKGRAS